MKRFHPWIFSGAIHSIEGKVQEGDTVEVYSSTQEYLGTGFCQIGSIAIKLISFTQTNVEESFWELKLTSCLDSRKRLGLFPNPKTNVFRLCFGEGDGLPGLIIDYYNGVCVIQTYSMGMHLAKPMLVQVLQKIFQGQLLAVYDKSEETMPKNGEIKIENAFLLGNVPSLTVHENGNAFQVDWVNGQKTGFFIDQRENRALLSSYSKGKSVLNTFCYTGGFSVYAAAAGSTTVHSVDSSKKATEMCNTNFELNAEVIPSANQAFKTFTMDTFDFLKNKGNEYDIVVLDPPAFAKSRSVTHNAIMGYKRLNAEAMKQIKPGGIIFSFSCSQVISRTIFNNTLMSAAIEAKRNVRILHQLSQPADHPINIFNQEGEYLKGLVLYVE